MGKASGGVKLKLITPEGNDYKLGGYTAYLNSSAVDGNRCFIAHQNAEVSKGDVWDIQYVEGKGWAIKNVGTGKYLKDATSPAKYDEPTYFTFCTLKDATSGIDEKGIVNGVNTTATGWYTLDGRKLKDKPAQRGLYIHNGKKVAIK